MQTADVFVTKRAESTDETSASAVDVTRAVTVWPAWSVALSRGPIVVSSGSAGWTWDWSTAAVYQNYYSQGSVTIGAGQSPTFSAQEALWAGMHATPVIVSAFPTVFYSAPLWDESKLQQVRDIYIGAFSKYLPKPVKAEIGSISSDDELIWQMSFTIPADLYRNHEALLDIEHRALTDVASVAPDCAGFFAIEYEMERSETK
jgi:hypothetical protein